MATINFVVALEGHGTMGLFSHPITSHAKVVSRSSKGFVIEYNDYEHTRAVVKGSGFSYGSDGLPTKGTIMNWTLASDGERIGSAKNLKMSAASFVAISKKPGTADDGVFFRKVFAGSDVITGKGFTNTLEGYGGNDTLIGGQGDDNLSGNKGADRFVYKSVADSTLEMSDRILDFSHAQKDKIDLKAIDANLTKGGNQTFTFIGTNGFTKAGQLRYEKDDYYGIAGISLLGDVNGDGNADLKIFLKGITKIQAGDFFL